jgi:hypothetical protein
LAQARNLEELVLGAYQVWEFFRSKLVQRREAEFQPSLRVMDEFAWLCYQPIRHVVWGDSPQCKEPPLVYLNGGWSPFVVVRNNAFRAEAVRRDLLKSADFKIALSSLPFPVLGVPWCQVPHLPDALILGHEVGHAVEADFELQGRLDAPSRRPSRPPIARLGCHGEANNHRTSGLLRTSQEGSATK